MKKYIKLLVLLGTFVPTIAYAKQVFTPQDPAWTFTGQAVTVEEIDGIQGIKIGRGQAILNDVLFENGSIEFKMYMPQERAFAYLYFRGENEQEYEEIYLRTHKSKAPDALQYAPVFQSMAAWQLYHGEKGTAAASFPANKWVPIKVTLNGSTLQVWVGDMQQPAMTIDRMGREPKAGWIGFRGFVPRTSDAPFSAYFSAITISPSAATSEVTYNAKSTLPSGQITQWRVSPAFATEPGPIDVIPSEIKNAKWIEPIMQPDGSFELLRSVEVPGDMRNWAAVAKVALHSNEAQTCKLLMGFSDRITLSLNNTILVYQDASYRFDKPRRQGLMHQEQLLVYLPLKKGKNELQAVIADNFGGWGLMGRLDQCDGIEIR